MSPKERLIQALQSDQPGEAAHTLAKAMRDEGTAQNELQKLYTERLLIHRDDPDEVYFDALADTLDYITGWCHPSAALFPNTTARQE